MDQNDLKIGEMRSTKYHTNHLT